MKLVSNQLRNFLKENNASSLFKKVAENSNDFLVPTDDWRGLIDSLAIKIGCHIVNEAVVAEGIEAFEKIK